MKLLLAIPTFAVAVFLGPARAGDEAAALEKARAAHAAAVKAADEKLLSSFDKTVEQIANQKLSTDRKLFLTDAIKAEKKRFEDGGLVPWSDPMWPFLVSHLQSLQAADAQLKRTYNAEIDKQLKAKNDTAVRDLRAELKAASGVRVLARWGHQAGKDGRDKIVLYSNGYIGDKDGPATWTVDKNNHLILRWPNATAPGGAWVDTCTVSPDGLTYIGSNQKGVKINGIYAPK